MIDFILAAFLAAKVELAFQSTVAAVAAERKRPAAVQPVIRRPRPACPPGGT